MTKFICTICKKEFKDASGLSKHLLLKKTRCDGVIDTDYWLRKQIYKLHERYKFLKTISEIPDEEFEYEMKKKILKAFYLKTCNILKIIEDTLKSNRESIPSISDEDVSKLKNYIDCCKTGVYV